jgi:hypothetical protein
MTLMIPVSLEGAEPGVKATMTKTMTRMKRRKSLSLGNPPRSLVVSTKMMTKTKRMTTTMRRISVLELFVKPLDTVLVFVLRRERTRSLRLG